MHLDRVRRRLTVCAALLLFTPLTDPIGAQERAANEYAVKAAYILLFTRYVEWPAGAFSSPETPLVVAVLGEDAFGPLLDDTLGGARSRGRTIEIRRAHKLDQTPPHVVIFGRASSEQQRAWFEQVSAAPVLTIAEENSPLRHQAVVTFITHFRRDEARVRFDVNLQAMRSAGLHIDSQMLSAANEIVRTAGLLPAGPHP